MMTNGWLPDTLDYSIFYTGAGVQTEEGLNMNIGGPRTEEVFIVSPGYCDIRSNDPNDVPDCPFLPHSVKSRWLSLSFERKRGFSLAHTLRAILVGYLTNWGLSLEGYKDSFDAWMRWGGKCGFWLYAYCVDRHQAIVIDFISMYKKWMY